MNKNIFIFILCFAIAFATGCTSTGTVITEFDANGKVVKETKTSQSVISSVVESTKDKTVVVWEDVWAGYISASAGTTKDPTPHLDLFIGKVNKGVITLHKDQQELEGISDIIYATRSELSANSTGISSQSTMQKSVSTSSK